MSIVWKGDLQDDCTAEWSGLILRAEWMHRNIWWWAVRDTATGEEVCSSNSKAFGDVKFTSGPAARNAAETAARDYLDRRTQQPKLDPS